MPRFPDYRVIPAEAIEEQSHMQLPDGQEALIWYHDAEHLKNAGFEAPPIEGTRCIAYLLHSIAHSDQGAAFLAHGRFDFRFQSAMYAGQPIRVETDDGMNARMFKTVDGEERPAATADCTIAPDVAPPDRSLYPKVALPDHGARPEPSLEVVTTGMNLGNYLFEVDGDLVQKLIETDYQEQGSPVFDRKFNPDAVVHPAFILEHCNKMVRFNFLMESSNGWGSIGNTVTWLRPLVAGESIELRARVRKAWDHPKLKALAVIFEYLLLDAAGESVAFASYFQTLKLYAPGAFADPA